MEKIRYEVDPHNRLIVAGTGKPTGLPRFRKVLDGKFKVEGNNTASYHLKSPLADGGGSTSQIKLQGTWKLSNDHELVLTLDSWQRGLYGDELTLRGDIIDVKANSIIFAMTTKTARGVQSTYALELGGSWQADAHNRLTFRVRRELGQYDILTFDGIWELNENHQILYRYERAQLKTRLKRVHTLVFRGWWDIRGRSRLSYSMGASTDSTFDFTTGIGIFGGDSIRYELRLGISRRLKPVRKIITLYGKWKIIKRAGLSFEVEYEDRNICPITFMAEASLTDKDAVIFKLRTDRYSRDVMGELKLSHRILRGDGEAFLRFLKSKEESACFVGAGWRW